jgi:hypothetical protein
MQEVVVRSSPRYSQSRDMSKGVSASVDWMRAWRNAVQREVQLLLLTATTAGEVNEWHPDWHGRKCV